MTITVHPTQYRSTIWVIWSSLRQLVTGLITRLSTGAPAIVWMLTLIVGFVEAALHTCETIAT